MTFRQDSTRSRDKKQFPTSVVYFIRERERARDGGVSEERRSRSAQAAVISGCVVTETSQPISNHHVCAVSIFPFSPHLKPHPSIPPSVPGFPSHPNVFGTGSLRHRTLRPAAKAMGTGQYRPGRLVIADFLVNSPTMEGCFRRSLDLLRRRGPPGRQVMAGPTE